jgi:hypothetical protein
MELLYIAVGFIVVCIGLYLGVASIHTKVNALIAKLEGQGIIPPSTAAGASVPPSPSLATIATQLAGLSTQATMIHAAVQAPQQIQVVVPPTVTSSPPAKPVDPRSVPGGSNGYVGSPSNNLTAYQAAGSPYYDLNGYQLTNAGAWTGVMLNPNGDGTLVPIPTTGAAAPNPYVWNGPLFAACGWWAGFPSDTPGPYVFTMLPNQAVAVGTTSRGTGNLSCTLTAKATGASFPTNGDTIPAVSAPLDCVLTVTGEGTVQLFKR